MSACSLIIYAILRLAWALQASPTAAPGRHSALHPAAPQGRQIEWMFWLTFWICFCVYVLMIIGFTRAAHRSYADEQERPLPIMEDPAGDKRAQLAVSSAVAVTFIALFIVLVTSIVSGKKVHGVSAENPVTIQVTGHQWWWEFTYLDSQPDHTLTTANEIHVPTGQRVAINTSSGDVIHSFWAPSITGKRDLIPGYSTSFTFQIDRPGVYRGQCAEFCGLQHAHMGFSIVAESPEQFETWKQQQLAPAKDPTDQMTQKGRDVFLKHACVMCHTIRGTQAASRFGPDLTHVASRSMIAAETLPNTPGALTGWILDPQQQKPGTKMAPNTLAPDDLQALITYLETLQ